MGDTRDSEHLQWLHDRIVNVYGEDKDIDFLIRLREIIGDLKEQEISFENYMAFLETKSKEKN